MQLLSLEVLGTLAAHSEDWKEIDGLQRAMADAVPFSSFVNLPQGGSFEQLKEDARKKDPWGREYFVKLLKFENQFPTVEVISCGPNRLFEGGRGDDLVVRANDVE